MSEYNQNNLSLEPRVAKLEGQLDRLTADVSSLASIVRDQGAMVEKQLNELTIAVTQASGPRKTDWSLLISAVLLIMAIGSAAFWPLNQTVQENKMALENLKQSFQEHGQLNMHPVGEALVNRIESQFKDHVESNKKEWGVYLENVKELRKVVNDDFNKQLVYIQKIHDLELNSLKERVDLREDRLYGRVVKLENEGGTEVERLKDELQMWRLKSMGVTISPSQDFIQK